MRVDAKLYHGEKYLVAESMINSFTWQMNLTVRNLHKGDFGQYICASENALGKSDARIRLQGKRDRKINFFRFTSIHIQLINLWHNNCLTTDFFLMHKLFLTFIVTPAAYISCSQNEMKKYGTNAELLLPKKPTTTPTPYIFTTMKPQRNRNKQQHNHQHKTQHEGKGTKDAIGGPNLNQIRESEGLSASEGN